MKPALPKLPNEKAEAYLKAMLEVKARFKIIANMRTSDWPANLRVEDCYLQLRHICDLVTVGALVIQGDYDGPLGDNYQPGLIFKKLEAKYGIGFPQAATISKRERQISVTVNSVPNAMTKEALLKLWSKSGDKLHRLKISKFFKAYDEDVLNSVTEINDHVMKLKALLNVHCLPIHTPRTLVLVALNSDGVRPSMAFLPLEADRKMNVHTFSVKGATNFFHDL